MDESIHVLCVDDEPRVTEALAMNLRRHFRVSTALNGQAGLAIVDSNDSPTVVVSDMRMPEMDGAAFLSQVRERAPDTVRILLTGQADIESAVAAVNHGQIFRFLTKPCKTETLVAAVRAAAEQHRLITAERVLLDQTLRGSIHALTDVLSLTNPLAFGRAIRLKQLCADVVAALGMPLAWQVEVAAMLSQIGCITLPSETHEKLYYGKPLTHDETDMVRHLPTLAVQLLERIPRLEAVRAILQNEPNSFDGNGNAPGAPKGQAIPLGARVLKIVGDYDMLEAAGHEPDAALSILQARKGKYDPDILAAFVRAKATAPVLGISEVPLSAVRPGMHLAQGVTSTSGMLLVARGQEVTVGLLQRLRNLPKGTVREPITVCLPADPKQRT
jgi:response regulator RpfG family c-di-GMP phosphodiesterase